MIFADTNVFMEVDDLRLAVALERTHGSLAAGDLVHLVCCPRRKVTDLQTYDRALEEVWQGG